MKVILLDGGPYDGEMVMVEDWQTVYLCIIRKEPASVSGTEEVQTVVREYVEDPNVPGHFIFRP